MAVAKKGMSTGTKVAIGLAAALGLYGIYTFFFKKAVPNKAAAAPPPGGSTNTAGQILNAANSIIGLFTAPKATSGAGPAASSAGNAAAGAGPVGSAQAQVATSWGSYTINAANQLIDANNQAQGYVAVDNNVYDNNGNLLGSLTGGPGSAPECQYQYDDASYVDDNGYYHNPQGMVIGFAGTDSWMYNIDGSAVLGVVQPMPGTNMPWLAGPPVDQGSGVDQYGQTGTTSN